MSGRVSYVHLVLSTVLGGESESPFHHLRARGVMTYTEDYGHCSQAAGFTFQILSTCSTKPEPHLLPGAPSTPTPPQPHLSCLKDALLCEIAQPPITERLLGNQSPLLQLEARDHSAAPGVPGLAGVTWEAETFA